MLNSLIFLIYGVWSNCILVVDKAKEVLIGDYKVFGDLTLDCFVVDLLSL